MTELELKAWAGSFASFTARFTHLFSRPEPGQQMSKYLRALLANLPRKNGWQTAELVGDRSPAKMQHLLNQARWDADAARDLLQTYIIEQFGEPEAIAVLDETGFLKHGSQSVGVKRQYTGTAGKVTNCQVATFLSYASSQGHVLLDRRLYLPVEWCADTARRERAKVPAGVEFATKPEHGIAMLKHAWAAGVPMRWVAGDAIYGSSPALRQAIAEQGKLYVLAVNSNLPVWLVQPTLAAPPPASSEQGRPHDHTIVTASAKWQTAARVLTSVNVELAWERLSAGQGEQGEREYDWARVQVWESEDGRPGRRSWLLLRRSISAAQEVAYYLSNAGVEVSLKQLAEVAGRRWTIEQCFAEAKGEVGLDEYEVRQYGAWYRHITLAMMAHSWLAATRASAGEKGGGAAEVGRVERGGSAAVVGSGIGAGTKERGASAVVVSLAAGQATGSTGQPQGATTAAG